MACVCQLRQAPLFSVWGGSCESPYLFCPLNSHENVSLSNGTNGNLPKSVCCALLLLFFLLAIYLFRWSLYIDQAGPKLRPTCLCLITGIKGVCHYTGCFVFSRIISMCVSMHIVAPMWRSKDKFMELFLLYLREWSLGCQIWIWHRPLCSELSCRPWLKCF